MTRKYPWLCAGAAALAIAFNQRVVPAEEPQQEEQVEIEVRHYGADEHGLRLLGNVAWRRATEESAGVGLCFANQPSAIHERRLRRFVLELLRYCTEDVDETKEEW